MKKLYSILALIIVGLFLSNCQKKDINEAFDSDNSKYSNSLLKSDIDISALEEIIALIKEIEESGDLNQGQSNALRKKIENAIQLYLKDNPGAAENVLGAFINQVEAYVEQGTIDPNVGDILISRVNEVIHPSDWTCGDILLDLRDGNEYQTINIDGQCWMSENLRYIPEVGGGSGILVYDYFGTSVEEAILTENYGTYGCLYHPKIAAEGFYQDGGDICPNGWHLPKWSEIMVLDYYNDPDELRSTSGWFNTGEFQDVYNGTNESGFNAIPGGMGYDLNWRGEDRYGFIQNGYKATVASSTGVEDQVNGDPNLPGEAWWLTSGSFWIDGMEGQHNSVRCVRDSDQNINPIGYHIEFSQDDFLHFITSAEAMIPIAFKAYCCDVETPSENLEVRWDWQNDGVWDTDFTTNKIAIHSFEDPGVYIVTFEVKDEFGLVNSYSRSLNITDNEGFSFFTDPRDNREYKTVKIGRQIWMAENLAYLPQVNSLTDYGQAPMYYVYGYNGSSVLEAKVTEYYLEYGVLYNGWAAKDACPDGWHLPFVGEFFILFNYLHELGQSLDGEREKVAKALASQETWNNSDIPGSPGYEPELNNSSLFNAKAGGDRYHAPGQHGTFWSSDFHEESDPPAYWYLSIRNDSPTAFIYSDPNSFDYSIRCIKDYW